MGLARPLSYEQSADAQIRAQPGQRPGPLRKERAILWVPGLLQGNARPFTSFASGWRKRRDCWRKRRISLRSWAFLGPETDFPQKPHQRGGEAGRGRAPAQSALPGRGLHLGPLNTANFSAL